MSYATKNKIRRMFGGRFTEKGEFIKAIIPRPRRYHCFCNSNGFTAGQFINHSIHCVYHPHNVQRVLSQEHPLVLLTVVGLVIVLCMISLVSLIVAAGFYFSNI